MSNIIVIGASGQIGSELTIELRNIFKNSSVVAADINFPSDEIINSGPFEKLNILNQNLVTEVFKKHNISVVYLLAAMLSGKAEKNPAQAWELNINSLLFMLELAKEGIIKKLFWPSSIAVFGPTTPKNNTPQITVTEPSTVYGISKLAGERWCEYYFNKYSVDVRSLRYPGLISYKTPPGGGTTDYAVEIFYNAIQHNKYQCFLNENTELPMMFMPDAIKGTIDLFEAPAEKIKIRSSYNIAAISFSPKQIAAEITKHIPSFEISYKEDFRQKIAESWPHSIDDSSARNDWGWRHQYDLSKMTEIMLSEIRKKIIA
jgi:nucleoside-diphosphate-sugar epimerase